MSGDKLTVTEALRKHLVGLLFDVDPMCGHADCEYTANLIAPSIVDFMTRTNTTTELVEALRPFVRMEKSIMTDLQTAHRRGPGVSEWMREDDRDMREALGKAFDTARKALTLHDRALGK